MKFAKRTSKSRVAKSILIVISLIILVTALFVEVFDQDNHQAGIIYATGGIEVDFTSDNWPFFETNFLPGDSTSKTVLVKNVSGRFQRVGFRINNTKGLILGIPLFIQISDVNTGEVYYGGPSGVPLLASYVWPKEFHLFNLSPSSSNNEKELKVEIRFIPQAGNEFQDQETKFNFSLGFIGRRFRRGGGGGGGGGFPFPFAGLFRR